MILESGLEIAESEIAAICERDGVRELTVIPGLIVFRWRMNWRMFLGAAWNSRARSGSSRSGGIASSRKPRSIVPRDEDRVGHILDA
jgi:hypothetical protein